VSRTGLLLCGVFLTAQVSRFVILNSTTPELTRGGRAFPVDGGGADGSVFSQTFDVRSGGLEAIRFEADTTAAGPAGGGIDVRLLGVDADGSELPLRSGRIAVSSDEDCCVFRFAPFSGSARRRYRLELQLIGGEGGGPALRAVAARDVGGLAINGRPQPANLVIAADGAELAPLRGARRVPLSGVLATFALVDGTLLFLVYALVVRPR
jgi:hypothetical protein